MNEITYYRTLNMAIFDRCFVFSLIKKIVTFYYNSLNFNHNIFKNPSNMSINKTEHKNCLAFLKATADNNINFIY